MGLSRSIEEIRSDLFARIEAVQEDYAAKGWLPVRLNLNKGVIRGLLEMFCWGQWQLYNFLDQVHKQAVPLTSTGAWLDLHCAQIGLTRKGALQARGLVDFIRGDSRGNIRIPQGRIVRTKPDGLGNIYRYVTEADAVLPEDAASVAVPVKSEEYGQGANASVAQICELATPVPGVASVENQADWLIVEGADAETDASLSRRYVLEWKSKAGITRAAYEAAALSVAGVVDVYVADQHPRGEGTVDVVIEGAAGLPTTALLEKVREALEEKIVINHDLLVKSPVPVDVAVKACLELVSGDEQAILAEAANRIRDLFSPASAQSARFSIGKDVIRDRLAGAVIDLQGVKRILWESPLEDVEVAADGLARLAALDLTTSWAAEA